MRFSAFPVGDRRFRAGGTPGLRERGKSQADPNAKPDPILIVRTQLEYIGISQEDQANLLFLEKPESSDATELWKKVQEMFVLLRNQKRGKLVRDRTHITQREWYRGFSRYIGISVAHRKHQVAGVGG